jgi:hypothetical protein
MKFSKKSLIGITLCVLLCFCLLGWYGWLYTPGFYWRDFEKYFRTEISQTITESGFSGIEHFLHFDRRIYERVPLYIQYHPTIYNYSLSNTPNFGFGAPTNLEKYVFMRDQKTLIYYAYTINNRVCFIEIEHHSQDRQVATHIQQMLQQQFPHLAVRLLMPPLMPNLSQSKPSGDEPGQLLYDILFTTISQWRSQVRRKQANAQFQFANSHLAVSIEDSSGNDSDITIGRGEFTLKARHRYRLKLDLFAKDQGALTFSCRQRRRHWFKTLQYPTEIILHIPKPGHQSADVIFTATTSMNAAWCTLGFGLLMPGSEITLTQFQLYDLGVDKTETSSVEINQCRENM